MLLREVNKKMSAKWLQFQAMKYETFDRQSASPNNPAYEVFPVKNNTLSLMWGMVF